MTCGGVRYDWASSNKGSFVVLGGAELCHVYWELAVTVQTGLCQTVGVSRLIYSMQSIVLLTYSHYLNCVYRSNGDMHQEINSRRSPHSNQLGLVVVPPVKSDHLWTSFICCCWTYQLEQFTWISAWSWTFNKQFRRQLKTFLLAQYWRRQSSALETLVPVRCISLLFTLRYIVYVIYIQSISVTQTRFTASSVVALLTYSLRVVDICRCRHRNSGCVSLIHSHEYSMCLSVMNIHVCNVYACSCWSYVGFTGMSNQTVSIGNGCQSVSM